MRDTGERVAELEKAFGHYHEQSNDGYDTCKVCGLNLRDRIHYRVGDPRLTPTDTKDTQ